MRISDWSSDVCSSDLADGTAGFLVVGQVQPDGALDRFGEFFQRQQGIGVSDEVGFRDGGTAAIHHAVLHHGSVAIDAPALAGAPTSTWASSAPTAPAPTASGHPLIGDE